MKNKKDIEQTYQLASEQYAAIGVDTGKALNRLVKVPISMHCWQGDDVGGFEKPGADLSGGGIQATGNYPGKASSLEQLRQDIKQALRLIPGRHRLNLHASYLDGRGRFIDRDEVAPEHFQSWIDWGQAQNLHGMDFNPTFFSHPKAADGFTLGHRDQGIRDFWIAHGIACRKIGAEIGKQFGSPAVTNFWVPDGYKDIPFDRLGPRRRLSESLDHIMTAKIDEKYNRDAIESKLFGIGVESYTAGSHEFCLSYAQSRNLLLCLDAGHFHPTEVVSDKLSSILMFIPEILLHVSRPVRWDSDHVVILNDELVAIAQELARGDLLDKVHIGLDYFDASINRVAAWVIGMRNMLKALLYAMLEPVEQLKSMEEAGDFGQRLALVEELKTMPFGTVWDYYCHTREVEPGITWYQEVRQYEKVVLAERPA